MANLITQNSIARIHDNPKDTNYHPIVQVISIKKIKTGKSQAATVVRFFFSLSTLVLRRIALSLCNHNNDDFDLNLSHTMNL